MGPSAQTAHPHWTYSERHKEYEAMNQITLRDREGTTAPKWRTVLLGSAAYAKAVRCSGISTKLCMTICPWLHGHIEQRKRGSLWQRAPVGDYIK
jgi:hypothetical protein